MYQRHLKIIELVKRQEYVSVEKLAQYFDVTLQTIRRDINKLSKDGLLQRHHGGAGLPTSVDNSPYQTRQNLQQTSKTQIARTLAEHIPDGSSLFINIGTTTEAAARALINKKNLTVITNNMNVANILHGNDTAEIVLTGGVLRKKDWGITGEATIDFIKQFKVDYGIIGISGIDEDGTLLDFDYNEVRVARTIIKNARNVFLVADHTKFERNAIVCLCHVSEVDAFFTDKTPPAKISNILSESGVDLFVSDQTDNELIESEPIF